MNAPVIIPPRKKLTQNQRVRMFDAHGGKCVICKQPIRVGQPWIDEHIDPLEISGNDSWDNRGPAHEHCAKEKTKTDLKVIAKVKRVRARHIGIKKPRKMTQWRKFNGDKVFAPRERG